MASEELVKIRIFNGHQIRERMEDLYFDATEMCKVHKKKWADFVRLDTTSKVIQITSQSTGIPVDSIIQQRSGRGGGTWIHRYVAVNLAQWLSPEFAVWVSDLVCKVTDAAALVPTSNPVLEQRIAKLESQLAERGERDSGPRWAITRRLVYRQFAAYLEDRGRRVERSAKNAIRRHANLLISLQSYDDGPEWSARPGDTYRYASRHLVFLDEAIDNVMSQVKRKDRPHGPQLPGFTGEGGQS